MSSTQRIAQRPAGNDDTPRDAGSLGIWHDVAKMTDVECFYQWEDLRAAPPEIQCQARVRMAALRRRLFGDWWAA